MDCSLRRPALPVASRGRPALESRRCTTALSGLLSSVVLVADLCSAAFRIFAAGFGGGVGKARCTPRGRRSRRTRALSPPSSRTPSPRLSSTWRTATRSLRATSRTCTSTVLFREQPSWRPSTMPGRPAASHAASRP